MVDQMTPPIAPLPPLPEGEGAAAAGSKPGIMSTTVGKVVVIGSAIIVFLGILGVVGFFAFTYLFGGAAQDAGDLLVKQPSSQSSSGEAADATETVPVEPGAVALSDIFTFRDVFDPLIKPEAAADTSSTSTTGEVPAGLDPDTLYLQDIVVEGGVDTAVMYLGGTEYRLVEGAVITGTPWQVLSIGTTTVTMLYGDSQVTLTIGQGVGK